MKRRRTITRRDAGITREAVEAFRRGDSATLRQELKLKPWQWPTPMDVNEDQPCPYPKGTAAAEWWPECLALQRELERLASRAG